jgi:flagellar motor protein MotB
VENGPSACDARTVKEAVLQEATVEAINEVLQCSDDMKKVLMQNIEAALADDNTGELEALNARLSEKQKELVRLAQAKKDYTVLADEIDKLNEKKQQLLVDKAENEGLKKRIRELETFLKEADQELTEYDETMVRKYIREIKVYEDHLLVCFEAGIEVEIDR